MSFINQKSFSRALKSPKYKWSLKLRCIGLSLGSYFLKLYSLWWILLHCKLHNGIIFVLRNWSSDGKMEINCFFGVNSLKTILFEFMKVLGHFWKFVKRLVTLDFWTRKLGVLICSCSTKDLSPIKSSMHIDYRRNFFFFNGTKISVQYNLLFISPTTRRCYSQTNHFVVHISFGAVN